MSAPINCLICGKRITSPRPSMVLLSTDGRVWATQHAPADLGTKDQGWFEVGSDCLRRVARAGIAGLAR